MIKKVLFVILVVVVTLLVDVLFGRLFAAKISTLPIVRKWDLLNPQAPIVINTREVVREGSSLDVQNTIGKVKNKVSSIVLVEQNTVSVTGSAISVSEDGILVTSKLSFPKNGAEYRVKLSTGEVFSITSLIIDPASNLVFVKTQATGLSVINLTNSGNLFPGQAMVSISDGSVSLLPRIGIGVVGVSQTDNHAEASIDTPSRTFSISGLDLTLPGLAVFNIDGDLAGIYDGVKIFPSDSLRLAFDNFFENKQKVVRPRFGFSYKYVAGYEAKILGSAQGLTVTKVSEGSSKSVGLLSGDIITQVGSVKIENQSSVEEAIQRSKVGSVVEVTVLRAGKEQKIRITPTAL